MSLVASGSIHVVTKDARSSLQHNGHHDVELEEVCVCHRMTILQQEIVAEVSHLGLESSVRMSFTWIEAASIIMSDSCRQLWSPMHACRWAGACL